MHSAKIIKLFGIQRNTKLVPGGLPARLGCFFSTQMFLAAQEGGGDEEAGEEDQYSPYQISGGEGGLAAVAG